MADALSDLRYISRMGYQDPWAEATKKISDSLLAYGQSKLKRDALIADYEDKQKERDYERGQDAIDNSLDILKLLPPEERGPQLDRMYKNGQVGESDYTSIKPTFDKIAETSTQWNNLFDKTKDKNATAKERFEAASRMYEISDTDTRRGTAGGLKTHYGNELGRENTRESMTNLGALNSVYLGNSMDMYQDAVDDYNFAGASQILNSKIAQTGKSVTAINSTYNGLVAHEQEMLKEYGEIGKPYIDAKNLRIQNERTYLSWLPKIYQNMPFTKALEAALAGVSPTSKDRQAANQQKTVKTKIPSATPLPTVYKPILNIEEEDLQIPDNSSVSLINIQTGQPFDQKFSGKVAKQLIQTGKATLVKDTAVSKFYWDRRDDVKYERGMVYESPEKPGFFDIEQRAEKRNKRIYLNPGDIVVELESGKEYPVAIEKPTTRDYTPDKVVYTVNGVSYNWKKFMSKFGKPMFQATQVQKTGAPQNLLDIQKDKFEILGVSRVQSDSDSTFVADSTNWMNPAIK
jgi:hypothetical protein